MDNLVYSFAFHVSSVIVVSKYKQNIRLVYLVSKFHRNVFFLRTSKLSEKQDGVFYSSNQTSTFGTLLVHNVKVLILDELMDECKIFTFY